MRNHYSFILLLSFCAFFACNSPVAPKPKGYSKIEFPAKTYQTFNEPGYPYAFEYPSYAKISKEVNYFGESKTADNWININFPEYQGTVYVSYRAIAPGQLDTLIRDAYAFVISITQKRFPFRIQYLQPRMAFLVFSSILEEMWQPIISFF